jgi:hypothetical protein
VGPLIACWLDVLCCAIFLILQVGLVSFFLPFFPLERRHLRQLFGLYLSQRSADLERQQLGGLRWDPEVVDFLTSKVSWQAGDLALWRLLVGSGSVLMDCLWNADGWCQCVCQAF